MSKWFQCQECKDYFPNKTPHSHGNNMRKHGIQWKEVDLTDGFLKRIRYIACLILEETDLTSIRECADAIVCDIDNLKK